ncbi:MAG: hypothetical protein WDO13_06865 [Verrucomicrobiota bacterium]
MTGQLASALVSRIRPQQSIVRRFDATISEAVITRIPVLLEAETLLDQEAPADLERALAKFREIAAALPEFARPLCGIAQAFCELALRGAGPTATLVAEAREPAARALQLDKDMIQAHAVTGWVQTLEWQWDEAERRFRTAIDLGSDVGTHRQFGLHLAARRRFDEAFHHLQKAQQADPFSQRQQIACARFFHLAGRGAEAEKHFADGVASGSLPAEAQVLLALIYLDHGQPDEAKRIAATLSQGGELSPPLAASVAEVLARGGDLDAARALEREAGLLSAASPLGHFRRALLLAALGAGRRRRRGAAHRRPPTPGAGARLARRGAAPGATVRARRFYRHPALRLPGVAVGRSPRPHHRQLTGANCRRRRTAAYCRGWKRTAGETDSRAAGTCGARRRRPSRTNAAAWPARFTTRWPRPSPESSCRPRRCGPRSN